MVLQLLSVSVCPEYNEQLVCLYTEQLVCLYNEQLVCPYNEQLVWYTDKR